MDPQKRNRLSVWLQIGTSVGSLIVAAVAIIIALNTEKRSAERFRVQLEQSSQIAKANIRPLLSIGSSGFKGIKLISLKNDGLGTAVVNKIRFIKHEKFALNLAELFHFKQKILWDNYYVFTNSQFYLRANESVTLLHLTVDGLKNQLYPEHEIGQIMKEFDNQQKGIVVQIEYEDLLGNEQTSIEVVLDQ